MSEKNPACRIYWDIRTRDIECPNPVKRHPVDMTRIPIGPPCEWPEHSTKNPHCGCPYSTDECFDYTMPSTIETRLHRLPRVCVKPPCNYIIPGVPCYEVHEPKPLPVDPLCFDWTVDEPGPNDSYGLNGLNWHDWKMKDYNQDVAPKPSKSFKVSHPGFSTKPPPPGTQILMCRLPIECYSAEEPYCKPVPFKQDVNYFRDWRCCEAKPPPPWKPPCVAWATNQHL